MGGGQKYHGGGKSITAKSRDTFAGGRKYHGGESSTLHRGMGMGIKMELEMLPGYIATLGPGYLVEK